MRVMPSSLQVSRTPFRSGSLYSRLYCTWSLARGTPLPCTQSQFSAMLQRFLFLLDHHRGIRHCWVLTTDIEHLQKY